MLSCHDNFEANFDNYPSMLSYHQALSMASSWRRCKVKDLHVEPLDPTSPLYGHPAAFAAGTSEDAIKDTAANLGLALNVDGNIYPVRGTAYKTLTERAKINGTALPKLSRKDLANVLNACLSVHNSDALLLIRNEKVSAVHSGDETDYSVLPMPFLPLPPQIPSASQKQQALNRRFSGEQLPEPQNGSRELKEIVAKACAYAPEDRYHSALEMRNALEALSSSKQAWTKAILEELALPEDILHESNRPIAQRAAAEEKPPKSDIPPAKRKPIVPLVVCGILGICILAGGLLWLNRKHASPEPAAMTEALQEQTETAAEPEETTAPGSTTEETLPAATEAESTAAVLLSNVDCTYEIAEDGITITGISGQTPSEVILPEELENLPVTRIGNGAFQSNTSLKKVTLPSGILVIGEKAFSGCTRLQSISFPDGLTEISASAFENCSNLSSVLLPESVHAIGPWAFSNCKKLLSITIPGSASDLGEWAFSGCSSLSELTFSPGITTISNYLFYNCQGLKAVTIPDGVITIGIGAFSGCTALSEVTLPESMRTLSSEAFQGTALESISVPSACSLGSNAVPLGCKIYSTR